MATAGARYEDRTGNIWSYAHRGDLTGLKAALARGVDADLPNTVGWTPAHAAAAGGRCKALRLLARAGADLDVADRGGDLPAHQAAKNGHAHALAALRELGADVARVRLSQAKGKAAREELLRAYKKAGRKSDGGDGGVVESDEEEVAVGYARKQARSTAMWGPRRQHISTKIKKKIIKEKRLRKKEKLERKWESREGAAMSAILADDGAPAAGGGVLPGSEEDTGQQEASYIETVRTIKRNRKNRRRQQQLRRQQRTKDEPASSNARRPNPISLQLQYESNTDKEDEGTNTSRSSVANGFSALLLDDSLSSGSE